jgi:hypothetical protein
MSDTGTINRLITSVNSLTGYFQGHRNQIEADRADLRREVNDLKARVSPGLQSLIGLLPNQAGTDADADGRPDGWYLPTNGGFTSWALAGSSTYGEETAIVPGSLEAQFYAGIPLDQGKNVGYRNFQFNFWRFSWDLSAGGAPDLITVLSSGRVPRGGSMGAWVCEETPGVLDHLDTYRSFTRGSGGWAIWHSHTEAEKFLGHPGGYAHPRLQFASADLPQRGSILVVAPQALVTRYPVDTVGGGFFPGLNRKVTDDDHHTQLSYVTNKWETKA